MAKVRQGAREKGGGDGFRIEAEIIDADNDEDQPELVAYAFGSSGALLGRTNLERGTGELRVKGGAEPDTVRVLVGPPVDAEDAGEILATLVRTGAAERMVRPGDAAPVLRIPIDRVRWHCWLRFCVVRGKLLKKVTSGGIGMDLPVCDAWVEIYEVDPVHVILPKIPDYVLEKLRDYIIKPPFPWPPEERFPGGLPFPPVPPVPGPGPWPGPDPRQAEFEKLSMRADFPHLADEQNVSPEGIERAGAEREPSERLFRFESGEPTSVDAAEMGASFRALSEVPEVRSAAAAGIRALRPALLAKPKLLRPLLCFLWPPAVTKQLVATTTTDDCGNFRAVFWQGCSSDTPDLYFKAFHRFGFIRFPILAPQPIACHTWWDYACGTEVVLHTTSPFARTCPPCPPVIAPKHWVLAMAVGNTSLARIHGTGTALPSTPLGRLDTNAPFGGHIRLRFEFDHNLRTDLNVRYYRLRWRKAGTTNPFLPLTADIRRHYAHWMGSNLVIQPYPLGVQTVGTTPNLYEIPPPLPPIGQWVIADAVDDTTSGIFPSVSFAPPAGAGLYEIELTLYDGGGNPVNGTALGISYRVPETTDLTTTIPTADASSLGLVTPAGRFVMTLHVDNNVCSASIAAPVLNGAIASDDCGVLTYASLSDTVAISWSATHPNGFATYTFNVVRGVTNVFSRPLAGAPALGPASETPTVGSLLGPCSIAGFAETLYVAATATDGWRRLNEYDHSAIRAFVLKP